MRLIVLRPLFFRVAALLAASLTLTASGGCSHLFSQPPPPRPLQWEGECVASRAPVVGDVVLSLYTGSLAVVGFAGAAFVAGNASNQTVPSWDPQPRSSGGMPLLLALGALGTVGTVGLIRSARYGLQSARACDAAKSDLMSRQMAWPPPPAWTWPPPPGGSVPPVVVPPPAPQSPRGPEAPPLSSPPP
jgi:hypothetical protein